jgi:ABC-type antimicrobial peptide transport system permease subunit
MNSKDMIALSLKNLLRRKTRTVLAILGVVIGICAIIIMLSIGFGLQKAFRTTIENFGNLHLITIYEGTGTDGGKKVKLSESTLQDIAKMPGVQAITPTITITLTFADGKKIARDVSVVGVRPDIFSTFGHKLKEGRNLEIGDRFSVVFGNQIPKSFRRARPILGGGSEDNSADPAVNPLNDKLIATANSEYGLPKNRQQSDPSRKVEYKTYKVKGIGVFENPDDFSTAYNVFMPLDIVKKIQEETARAEKKNYDRSAPYPQAIAYVDEIERVTELNNTLRAMGYQTSSMTEYLEASKKQMRMIQTVLGGIGAVSLLVAALGITNTMVMSIYERTREIGIMKVIGANLPDIRKLFLIEAAMIGFGGGLAGVILSYMFSFAANKLLSPMLDSMGGGNISLIPLWLPLTALGFSTAVGILAGYSPARRAMNLSALESLRND